MENSILITEQNKLILNMIGFYDKWKYSDFRISHETHTYSIKGGDISKWLSSMVDNKNYSNQEQMTFDSLKEIYTIHQ